MPYPERVLMGPGPTNPYPEVMAALARPLLGHLDPAFLEILEETADGLRATFRTANEFTFPISGTGSAGMEAAMVNVINPGDVVVVGVNGLFGERMCDVAERCQAEVVRVDAEWGQPLDPHAVLRAHPSPALIAAVHAETSTGIRNDIAALGAGKGDALLLVDCVTSLGGMEVDIDAWQVDIAYAATQKCLGVPPGLAPLTINDRARKRFVERAPSWYLDLRAMSGSMVGGPAPASGGSASTSGGSGLGAPGAAGTTPPSGGPGRGPAIRYHHTAPIAMVQALHAGLVAVHQEGLEVAWARHAACGQRLQSGLEALGLRLFAAAGHRLAQVTTVAIPDGVDDLAVRRTLLDRYDVEIGGGIGPLAGKVWRIGCMGHSARPRNVALLLRALEEVLIP